MTTTRSPAHLRGIRQENLRCVLLSLAEAPGSRADLAQRTGLTKATVASLIEPLLAQGLVAEDAPLAAGRGRPSRRLRFHPRGPVAVGVEVNVGYIAVTTLGLDGRSAASRRHEVDNRERSADGVLGEVTELVGSVVAEVQDPVLGVCLAVPGIVDDQTVVRAPNLPRLVGARLGLDLAARLGLAGVGVDNEANLAARAHLWPRRMSGGDFICVSGEVGIGAGLVMNGELYRGASGFAGELGHVVIERAGRACTCGGQGCVEQYAGLRSILRASRRRGLVSLRRALDDGDPTAVEAVRDAGGALGVALSSLLNVCDVPTVVLGGIYASLFEHLTPAVEEELARRVLVGIRRAPTLQRSPLGARAAALGAAGAITHRACTRPDWLLSVHEMGR